MDDLTLLELKNKLKNKDISSVELAKHYLDRIEKYQPNLNAFVSINRDNALKQAETADKNISQNNHDNLMGIPLAHKDIFCTKELPTTCASRMLKHFQAPYNATIVELLAHSQTILLGKTNMDEFAMGSANENSYFGTVKNPWNLNKVPGGSSGGSAAAVAARLTPFATGTDTGGSIRQPAAFCGISGIKPTYGRVSRYGMVAFASSLDQAGPMARSVEDLSLILQTMAGFDPNDSTSSNTKVPHYLSMINKPIGHMKIGISQHFFQPNQDEDTLKAVKKAISFYEQEGADIIEIDLSLQPYWVPCYYIIACAEASSNLQRYDGIRYGHRSQNEQNLIELIKQSRSEGFGDEVKRRIMTGTYVLSAGYFDAYYRHAQKVRRLIQAELLNALKQVDVIIGPTTPSCAFSLDEEINNPTERYLADTFTVAANLAGLPALSIPVGFNREKLPIGMQLMGHFFEESKLLQMGHLYQQATTWHQERPEGF